MAGFSVMVRKPGRRAYPVYPLWPRFGAADDPMRCNGSTRGATDSFGRPGRPCSLLRRDDAERFARWLAMHYAHTDPAAEVVIVPR